MSTLRSIVKNTSARTGAEIFNRASSALFWILVARYAGASGLGMLVFGMSLFTLFQSMSTLGLGAVVTRDVAQKKEVAPKYLGTGLTIGCIATVIFTIAMIAMGRILGPDIRTWRMVMILTLSLLPASIFYWSKSVLIAVEKMEFIACARLVENSLKIIFGSYLLVKEGSLEMIALVIVASKVVSAAMCLFSARLEAGAINFRFNKDIVTSLFGQIPIFASISFFNTLFWSSTIILLTHLSGTSAAGLFGAAFKLVDLFVAITMAFGQSLFPVSSRLLTRAPDLFENLCRKSVKFISIFTLAIVAGVNVLSERIMTCMFGQSLLDAAVALRVQIWLLLPFGLVPIFAFALISSHHQKQDLKANIIASLALIGLNVVLIPRYDVVGASIALVMGCIVFSVCEYFFVHTRLFKIKLDISNIKVIGIAGLMAAFAELIINWHILFVVLMSGVFYLIMINVTGVFSQNDKQFCKSLKSV